MQNTIVTHLKSGGKYQVLGAFMLEANLRVMVLYGNGGLRWARPIEEFTDGRFSNPYGTQDSWVRALLEDAGFKAHETAAGYYGIVPDK